jgi:hypothetical protein
MPGVRGRAAIQHCALRGLMGDENDGYGLELVDSITVLMSMNMVGRFDNY